MLPVLGSLEAAFSILSLGDGLIPHTLNLATADPDFRFTLVKDTPVSFFSIFIGIIVPIAKILGCFHV